MASLCDINNLIASKTGEAYQRNCSGLVTNPERFSTGLVLPFTHNWTNPKLKLPSLATSPEILNPECKVESFNLGTFESGEF